MKTHDISLIKNSWQLVAKIEIETVGGLFYNRLFEIAPEVKPMFKKTALPEQSRKLMGMLSYIVSKLDSLDDILDEVTKLAQRHTKYGVKERHYTAVGAALIWTLEKGLGSHWNNEVRLAWIKVYAILSTAMITAQEEVEEQGLVWQ